MRIICLQFGPLLGQRDTNISTATRLLETSKDVQDLPADHRDQKPIWLLLPELAFSGYNFQTVEEIAPFLEPRGTGPSSQWARLIAMNKKWYVTVGYPESTVSAQGEPLAYNSTITYGPLGNVVAHYRKRYLYYTDETWAREGDGTSESGFYGAAVGDLGQVSMGICMDINPYKFTAPWSDYEFANHVLKTQSPIVVLNMAWLSTLSQQELADSPEKPDQGTFGYWLERFHPLRQSGAPPTIVACANRCGVEGAACYAGSSAVFLFSDGKISLCGILGKAEEGCLVVDTDKVSLS